MHSAGVPSWRVEIDEPADLHQLLFVRDACRLGDTEPIEPDRLGAPVPDLSSLISSVDRTEAMAAWIRWWGEAVARHRGEVPTHDRDAERARRLTRVASRGGSQHSADHDETLRAALAASYDAFSTWWSPPVDGPVRAAGFPPRFPGVRGQLIGLHLGSPILHDVVVEIEHELGRRASPFDLRIEPLGVTGPDVVVRDRTYVLVSSALMADTDRYRAWLKELVIELA